VVNDLRSIPGGLKAKSLGRVVGYVRRERVVDEHGRRYARRLRRRECAEQAEIGDDDIWRCVSELARDISRPGG